MTIEEAKQKGATHYQLSTTGKFIQNFFKQKERTNHDKTKQLVWYYWGPWNKWEYMVNLNDKKETPENLTKIE